MALYRRDFNFKTLFIVPVLFLALSRLQGDDEKFNMIYFDTQRFASIFVFPLGIGVYLYSDLATRIILGSKWSEASGVIGIWVLTSSIMTFLEIFVAKYIEQKVNQSYHF